MAGTQTRQQGGHLYAAAARFSHELCVALRVQCYRKNLQHRAEQYHAPPPKVRPLSPFPTPFEAVDYGDGSQSCQEPRTLRELSLIKFAGAIREKPNWWNKVHDKAITDKSLIRTRSSSSSSRATVPQQLTVLCVLTCLQVDC